MEFNNTLCLYVSYYLSRFDREAYKNLGYKSMLDAHKSIGKILKVNPNTVQNMRDEFDPLHGHRKGWYQAPLSPSRVTVVRALENLDELTIRNIVLEILENKNEPDVANLVKLVSEDISENKSTRKFILRGPTGKRAEDFFINYHAQFGTPFKGELIDKREYGCGYDFEIQFQEKKYFIEIKGLSTNDGGILFTNKEWVTAKEKGNDYFVVIIKSVNDNPKVSIIQNPTSVLKAKRGIYTTVQVSWSVPENELN